MLSAWKWEKTPHFSRMVTLTNPIIAMFTGNQAGKTNSAAAQYFLRIMGLHPVQIKNKYCKHIRCLSSSLPTSTDENESTNTQYLELKKLLPPEAILKDVTIRSPNMIVRSPTHGKVYLEFMSWKQDLQDVASVQRDSLWEDEEPPKAYREESRRRLMHTNGKGDEIITLTPKNGLTYLYDDIWNKKSYLWRSDRIVEALNLPKEERDPQGDKAIACIQIATDDNPTMTKEGVEANFASEDPGMIMTSRYGVFKQVQGQIHKVYNRDVHYIPFEKYFPDGIPYNWCHARGIDYHESRTPWSIGWLSASPDDEWFLWKEFHPAIDGPYSMATEEIARGIVRRSNDFYYLVNLIDPLANKKQANTLTSVTDDLNRMFYEMKNEEGLGTECYWQGWDTKDTKGRDQIRLRLKNATKVKRPFNNTLRENGVTKRVPTLWICDTCPKFDTSIRKWSYNEWQTVQTQAVNDPQSKPRQRYSHDNMVLECLAKDARLLPYIKPEFVPHRNVSTTGRGYGTRLRAFAR